MTAEVSALVAVLAAALSAVQLIIMRSSSRGTILTEAALSFWNRSSRQDRGVVQRLEGKPFSDWTPDEMECAERVAIQISQLALLMRHSYADRQAFLDYWGSWCIRFYKVLSPLIAHQRVVDAGTDQGIYFEWLARTAMVHARRRPWWQRSQYLRLKRSTMALPDPDEI